jgi:hypothetical protein
LRRYKEQDLASVLANRVAHDLHHIRQLNKLRYGYLAANSTVRLDHAGTW